MFKLFPIQKDAFISKRSPSINAGQSSQLYVVRNDRSDQGYFIDPLEEKRSLIKANSTGIISYMDIINDEVELRLLTSDIHLYNEDFSVKAYPVTKEWVEGIGKEFVTDEGVTWKDSQNGTLWTLEGGDFDSLKEYDVEISEKGGYATVDLKPFLTSINNAEFSDYGIILKVKTGYNRNLSFYSNQTTLGNKPYVVVYKDDFSIDPLTTGIVYDGSESNMYIKTLRYNSRLERGQSFHALVNIESYVNKASFTGDVYMRYVEDNLSYQIKNMKTDNVIIPYSDYTRIPVKTEGHTISFSTEGFSVGSYALRIRYKGTEYTQFSEELRFIIT